MTSTALTVLALLAASLLTTLAFVACWRRQTHAEPAEPQPTPTPIVYRDTPTIRMVDAHRVDRLRRVVHLRCGEHVDVVETVAGLPARFRITLKRLDVLEQSPAAHIAVEFGGARLSGGPAVKEFAFNEFIMPRALRDESRCCVYHLQERGDAMEFMRIKLRQTDAASGLAELDVMQLSGHWPS